MPEEQNTIVKGVKTFFVVPELSLFSEDFLKTFFLYGFETYFIHDDPYCPLDKKIHQLFASFPELILFFNIDRPVQGIQWFSFIRGLQITYGDRARIGVMYQKLNSQEDARRLERMYLYEIGISCGCIPIEYQKSKNLPLFLSVLFANQANGQRKHLRAICDESYRMNMAWKGQQFRCILRDISISHFSCVFSGELPDLPMHEKICNIQMNLKGLLCTVDAVMCLKRAMEEETLHVFVFRTLDDRDGLNPDQLARVNNIIFNSMQGAMADYLHALFEAERQRTIMARGPRQKVPAQSQPDPFGISKEKATEIVRNLDVTGLLASLG